MTNNQEGCYKFCIWCGTSDKRKFSKFDFKICRECSLGNPKPKKEKPTAGQSQERFIEKYGELL